MNKRAFGTVFEKKAESFLEEQGYLILERNFRCRSAEADLVAMDGKYLVFAEVKARRSPRAGSGAEAVDRRKQMRILHAARVYLMLHHLPQETPVRFDVVSIDAGSVRLIRNAFEGTGL